MSILRTVCLFLFATALLASCAITDKGDEYELTLESCYAMKSDNEHPFWKQLIAVQGCEMLISEYELKKVNESE